MLGCRRDALDLPYCQLLCILLCMTIPILTAADVRCAAANTRKMVSWMICCMVSEGGHCSSEVQYTLN